VRDVRKVDQANVRREHVRLFDFARVARRLETNGLAVVEEQERAGDELGLLLLVEPRLERGKALEELVEGMATRC
jgi:hypothetical protein